MIMRILRPCLGCCHWISRGEEYSLGNGKRFENLPIYLEVYESMIIEATNTWACVIQYKLLGMYEASELSGAYNLEIWPEF